MLGIGLGELPGMCPRENVNRRTSLQMVLSVGYDICIYRGDEEDMYVKIFLKNNIHTKSKSV